MTRRVPTELRRALIEVCRGFSTKRLRLQFLRRVVRRLYDPSNFSTTPGGVHRHGRLVLLREGIQRLVRRVEREAVACREFCHGRPRVGNFGTRGKVQKPPEYLPSVASNTGAVIDKAEREAIAIELGGVPELYASAFAQLQAHAPPAVPDRTAASIHQWRRYFPG